MPVIDQSKTKIFLLILSVFIHSIFIAASVFFMVFSCFTSKRSIVLDSLVAAVIISFILFKKCIMIDIYEYIKNLDGLEYELPAIAKDNYLRNSIKKFLGLTLNNEDEVDYTPLRLDDITNTNPMKNLNDEDVINHLYNRKMHYIIGNIILIMIMISKYNLTKGIPVFVVWLVKTFKV